ncbi:MAG: ThuA domain-containing protein [Lentisphaeria bacterium]|nr:ThuA domain-containing protein [Lentisphaeria bacterium]
MKKALVFRGGWEGHDPVESSDIVAAELQKRQMTVDIFDDQECLLKRDLTAYDVIIPVWTMGDISNEAEKALLAAVAGGVGVGGWHGGMCDAFRNHTDYQFMTGGQWVAHPGGVIDYQVNIISDDPIVSGIRDFAVKSEQYYMHVDPGNEVLATTRFNGDICPWIDGTVMPVVWKRKYGQGKVFFCSLGHQAEEFKTCPQLLEIVVRGILWAAK